MLHNLTTFLPMRTLEENRNYTAYLYPEIEPYATGMLPVDASHTLYWETSGNPDGVPVVFLHGGPGSGCAANHRRFFDPAFYRIVLVDQRGAGRSTPHAEMRDNTTQHLIADLEALRARLGIERWLVFGGSWGSTLALAYGEAHAENCLGFILRGIFLGRAAEVEWFMQGMRNFFPEVWWRFAEFIPDGERSDLLAAYQRRLGNPDPSVHLPAARHWSAYEAACCTLLPDPQIRQHFDDDRLALSLARTECHYFVHRLFLDEGELLDKLAHIRHLPCSIVQGRYDVVCPPASAYDLYRAWPEAEFIVVPDAGHAAWEPGTTEALVRAADAMKMRVKA